MQPFQGMSALAGSSVALNRLVEAWLAGWWVVGGADVQVAGMQVCGLMCVFVHLCCSAQQGP